MLIRHIRFFKDVPKGVLSLSLFVGIIGLLESILWYILPPEFEKTVHGVGMVLLLMLTILITFSDIKKIF